MCVYRVAKCPPARVAIQPPSVESSNDCGKWRSVRPCSASCSSSRGPLAPAWMRAARDTPSTSSTRVERAQVERDRPGRRPAASTPPTTLVPPPYGITAAPARRTRPSTRSTLGLVARVGDDVGRVRRTGRGSARTTSR